jgi:hypothetical protein
MKHPHLDMTAIALEPLPQVAEHRLRPLDQLAERGAVEDQQAGDPVALVVRMRLPADPIDLARVGVGAPAHVEHAEKLARSRFLHQAFSTFIMFSG